MYAEIITAHRIRLTTQGYEVGPHGGYYGTGNPVYRVQVAIDNVEEIKEVRAYNREDAIDEITALYRRMGIITVIGGRGTYLVPRNSVYYGMETTAQRMARGTWLEPEELCYSGGDRRARAIVDGTNTLRIVRCRLPSCYFAIPTTDGQGSITINTDEPGYAYLVYTQYDNKR